MGGGGGGGVLVELRRDRKSGEAVDRSSSDKMDTQSLSEA